ncbi:hypothetical protein [Paenibacillus eucommiae]|uniref:Uncharacterized protein n=1 Tax=Paenibacillus eucommiae TaxID=1355755 RepID=A0ABS4IV74_9BACL|nr:hypothetical protein [Paenibacillus eucommiae]MBP1991492.1 hypothetical protein [Paenibacillus eucommiae]
MNAAKASIGSHMLTMLMGTWLVVGIFIDGYAHNHGMTESFFSPWHGILYSGFMASAAWILGLVYVNKRRNASTWRQAIPVGYGLGLIGVFVFLTGGICDMIWHLIFGIEQNLTALLSPSHLLLMLGTLLIISSPFRAGWEDSPHKPAWRPFFPTLLSASLSVVTASFFLMYMWMFRYNLAAPDVIDWYKSRTDPFFGIRVIEDLEIRGLTYILMNTLLFMYPVFLLLKRWQLPFGSITFLFTCISVLMGVLDGFQQYQSILISLAAGLAADSIHVIFRHREGVMGGYRVLALVVPVVLWGGYFLSMALSVGIGWDPELWAGSMVQASLLSLAISILAISPTRGGNEHHSV